MDFKIIGKIWHYNPSWDKTPSYAISTLLCISTVPLWMSSSVLKSTLRKTCPAENRVMLWRCLVLCMAQKHLPGREAFPSESENWDLKFSACRILIVVPWPLGQTLLWALSCVLIPSGLFMHVYGVFVWTSSLFNILALSCFRRSAVILRTLSWWKLVNVVVLVLFFLLP